MTAAALHAGGSFAATLEPLVERFPHHAKFIRAFDACSAELRAIDPNVAIL